MNKIHNNRLIFGILKELRTYTQRNNTMNTPKIELYIDGCFTYIREKDSEGLVVHRVNTTDKKEALNLYNNNSHRVAFVGSLYWLD